MTNKKISWTKKRVIQFLEKMTIGSIELHDPAFTKSYGDPSHSLSARLTIHDDRFYSLVFWRGSLGMAEAYIDKLWETDHLTTLIQILVLNIHVVDDVDHGLTSLLYRYIERIRLFFTSNNQLRAKKNIAEHYDLGNEFFKLILDKHMMYSSAKFYNKNESLDQASQNKLKLSCEKLRLKPTDHLLEIGSGWGGFACYAASQYGCKVTTTTISQQQFEHCKQQVNQLGLSEQVTVLFEDYRNLQGQFDKIVSIEMIEAVGHQYFKKYFHQCGKLLKENGLFLLQAIVISDQRYEQYKNAADFINKYIFPGGCLPSLSLILKYMRDMTTLNVVDVEDISKDYAQTLSAWRDNFIENKQTIKDMSFPDSFIRTWLYYFSYCQAAFLERNIADIQILFANPGFRYE